LNTINLLEIELHKGGQLPWLAGSEGRNAKSNGSGNSCDYGQGFAPIYNVSHQTLLSGVTYTVTLEGNDKDQNGRKSLI